jgi:hypothetical protein
MQKEKRSVTSECRWDQNGRQSRGVSAECWREDMAMDSAPSTIGILLAFAAIFLGCIVWATRGHPSDADNEDLGVVAKDH